MTSEKKCQKCGGFGPFSESRRTKACADRREGLAVGESGVHLRPQFAVDDGVIMNLRRSNGD